MSSKKINTPNVRGGKAAWQTAWLKVKKIAPNIWGGKPRGNRLAEGKETTP